MMNQQKVAKAKKSFQKFHKSNIELTIINGPFVEITSGPFLCNRLTNYIKSVKIEKNSQIGNREYAV